VASDFPPIPSSEPSLEKLETIAIEQRFDLAAARSKPILRCELLICEHTQNIYRLDYLGVDTERTPDRQRVTGPILDLECRFRSGQAAIAKLGAQYARPQWKLEAMPRYRSQVRQARETSGPAPVISRNLPEDLPPATHRIVNETVLSI